MHTVYAYSQHQAATTAASNTSIPYTHPSHKDTRSPLLPSIGSRRSFVFRSLCVFLFLFVACRGAAAAVRCVSQLADLHHGIFVFSVFCLFFWGGGGDLCHIFFCVFFLSISVYFWVSAFPRPFSPAARRRRRGGHLCIYMVYVWWVDGDVWWMGHN